MQNHTPDDDIYERPTLVVLGSLQEITKQAGLPNADTPQGNPNTAFPVSA